MSCLISRAANDVFNSAAFNLNTSRRKPSSVSARSSARVPNWYGDSSSTELM